jgi:hypothetical protein
MYESAIEMITGHMRLHWDGEIYRAVQDIGIKVDREELIKALEYDRNQYDKGYTDGIRKYAERLKENFTEQWCGSKYELIHSWIDNLVEEMLKGGDT